MYNVELSALYIIPYPNLAHGFSTSVLHSAHRRTET